MPGDLAESSRTTLRLITSWSGRTESYLYEGPWILIGGSDSGRPRNVRPGKVFSAV